MATKRYLVTGGFRKVNMARTYDASSNSLEARDWTQLLHIIKSCVRRSSDQSRAIRLILNQITTTCLAFTKNY